MSKVKLVFAAGWSHRETRSKENEVAFGLNNALPWGHLKEDLASFKINTEGSVLLMGANTFKSLPAKLKGRLHVVMSSSTQGLKTRDGSAPDTVIHGGSISNAVSFLQGLYPEQDISIIGGKGIILEALKEKLPDEIYFNIIFPTNFSEWEAAIDFEFDVGICADDLLFDGYVCYSKSHTFVTHPKAESFIQEKWKKLHETV